MKRATITIGFVALFMVGAATAAVVAKRITLHAGQCVTVSKTKVCAASAPTRTVHAPPLTTTVTLTSTVSQTVTAPPPPPATAFGDGTFRVGSQIQPGTYQAVSPGSSCYWARLSGFDGLLGSIIANSFGSQTIVTIQPSDAGFLSERCGAWTKIG